MTKHEGRRKPVIGSPSKLSGREAIDLPGTILLPRVTKAIVQPIRTTLPEFDSFRLEPISAPMRRQRNLSLGEALFHFLEPSIEHPPRVDHLALARGPRVELRAGRASV